MLVYALLLKNKEVNGKRPPAQRKRNINNPGMSGEKQQIEQPVIDHGCQKAYYRKLECSRPPAEQNGQRPPNNRGTGKHKPQETGRKQKVNRYKEGGYQNAACCSKAEICIFHRLIYA